MSAPSASWTPEVLIDNAGGDAQFAVELGTMFLDRAVENEAALELARETASGPGLHQAAHALCAASGYIGAPDLQDMARQVMKAAQCGDVTTALDRCAQLRAELARVRGSLRRFVEERLGAA